MGAIDRYIAKRYLYRMSREYLDKFPQMAVFSFDSIGNLIALDGQYDRVELEFLSKSVLSRLPTRGVCLDVGANIGNHALHFSKFFEHVVALEPNPRTYSLLACNAGLVSNVTPVNVGASDVARTAQASAQRHNVGMASVSAKSVDVGDYTVPFVLVRIDDMPEIAGRDISFMKIDVEGHEAECIRGAAETLARCRPVVAVEVLRDTISNGTAASLEALKAIGYCHFYAIESQRETSRMAVAAGKFARFLRAAITNERPSRDYSLVAVTELRNRDYGMLICSMEALSC